MLPFLYNDRSIGPLVAQDPQTAPIPELHKAMFAWVEKFTRRSWTMTREDMQPLLDGGVDEKTLVRWAQVASMQTWWVMMADGGGVALDGESETGIGVQHKRDWYEEREEGLLAGSPGQSMAAPAGAKGVSWLGTKLECEEFKAAAESMDERYGFVPNLIRACSLDPSYLKRQISALELLERPQSVSLTPRLHALVRSMTASLNRAPYSASTLKAMFERIGETELLYARISDTWDAEQWSAPEKTVLEFTIKAVQNAYKITEKDAQGFRDAGLDDEAYVDVINTIAIQSSIDRLTNSLGVQADNSAMLPRD